MTLTTEVRRAGEHILSEGNGTYSREQIVVNAGAGKLAAGTLMGKRTTANSGTPTAGSNTGNGVLGTVTVGNTAITGTYTVRITAAATNAGTFSVLDPFGNLVGTGTVGVLFSGGGLSFTLADGATDFVVNDSFTIAVIAGLGEWVAYADAGTNDGRRVVSGILYAPIDATFADANAIVHVRHCEVAGSALTGSDVAGVADLLALGIIVR